jgi:hypothetical protein
MVTAGAEELVEVVKYWRDTFDILRVAGLSARTETAVSLMKLGVALLKPWADGS